MFQVAKQRTAPGDGLENECAEAVGRGRRGGGRGGAWRTEGRQPREGHGVGMWDEVLGRGREEERRKKVRGEEKDDESNLRILKNFEVKNLKEEKYDESNLRILKNFEVKNLTVDGKGKKMVIFVKCNSIEGRSRFIITYQRSESI